MLTGPPVATTSPGSTLLSPSRADWMAAAVASHGNVAVVCPSSVSANLPPDVPPMRTVWVSFVFMSLCGEKPPELPPPEGVSSPVTSHRLFCLSKSMSPPTWQHAPRLTITRMIFCSLARSRCAGSPGAASTNLKRESWK